MLNITPRRQGHTGTQAHQIQDGTNSCTHFLPDVDAALQKASSFLYWSPVSSTLLQIRQYHSKSDLFHLFETAQVLAQQGERNVNNTSHPGRCCWCILSSQ